MSCNLHSLCERQKKTRKRTVQSCMIYSGTKVTVACSLLGSQKWFSNYFSSMRKDSEKHFEGKTRRKQKEKRWTSFWIIQIHLFKALFRSTVFSYSHISKFCTSISFTREYSFGHIYLQLHLFCLFGCYFVCLFFKYFTRISKY